MARRYTMSLRCAQDGGRETIFAESSTRAEEAESRAWYAKHPYRCYRHTRPDEVLSAENRATTAELTAHQTYRTDRRGETIPLGTYWGVTAEKAHSGSVDGPGFKAIAKDFPPGTRLIVTAR